MHAAGLISNYGVMACMGEPGGPAAQLWQVRGLQGDAAQRGGLLDTQIHPQRGALRCISLHAVGLWKASHCIALCKLNAVYKDTDPGNEQANFGGLL